MDLTGFQIQMQKLSPQRSLTLSAMDWLWISELHVQVFSTQKADFPAQQFISIQS